jgi:molybdate transport system substrate-binding protein
VVTNGLTVLMNPAVKRVAIANPEHAPYGRAARAALDWERLWSDLQRKLVIGENIAQATQIVQTGNVDAGIVALSVVSAPKLKNVGVWWLIPEEKHPPLHQGMVLTQRGASNPSARRYLEFLRTTRAREIFERFGFRLPAH